MKRKVTDIIVRDDLYPRLELNLQKVQEYSENIELLPPIIVNQDNILIDGKHRLIAHKKNNLLEIECVVETTSSDDEIRLRAIETNSTHGLQLSNDDKKSLAIKLYDLKNTERLLAALSVSPRTFERWVSKKADQLREEQNKKIIDLYLHAELTQKQISEELCISEGKVNEILKKCQMAKNEDFEPFLYNIWNKAL